MTAPDPRARALFRNHLEEVYVRRSRVLGWLMLVQWLCGIVVALVVSPNAWAGRVSSTHVHVYTAIGLGGLLSVPAMALAALRPAWVVTRHVMAVRQMAWSALLIHLTGGRIETHFHIFGSLAFLAFYRDWRVLVTATIVVAGEHLGRSLTWPDSVFGTSDPEWWRFIEHAFWVVFEDVVLLLGIRDAIGEMRRIAEGQSAIEQASSTLELRVAARTSELEASREEHRAVLEATRTVPWRLRCADLLFVEVSAHANLMLGCSVEAWLAPDFLETRVHPDDLSIARAACDAPSPTKEGAAFELRLRHDDGNWRWVRFLVAHDGSARAKELKGIMVDVSDQRRLLLELGQAQKLESVGRLASGIAHELNTPIQFVSDSLHFISESFASLFPLLGSYQLLHRSVRDGGSSPEQVAQISEDEEAADLEYLLENVPKAIERSADGLTRVSTLVRSMKEFAHPGKQNKSPADLNRAIESTLAIARNEIKYVAEVETALAPLPLVECYLSELNQVFLNIIVNAAHAIGEKVKGTDQRGLIRVGSRALDDAVEITISDTGGGIPEAIRSKVFEPFFTTKAVGVGTGQGLAIAHSVVVAKHQGTVTFESVSGVGTTFFIRIPVLKSERQSLQEAA